MSELIMPGHVCAIALIREDGAMLMQHRDNKPGLRAADTWVFPGGHVDSNESLETCAIREFKEETNYLCKDVKWLLSMDDVYQPGWPPYRLEIFWDIYDGEQTIICGEGQDMKFLPRKDTELYNIKNYQIILWDLVIEAYKYIDHDKQ